MNSAHDLLNLLSTFRADTLTATRNFLAALDEAGVTDFTMGDRQNPWECEHPEYMVEGDLTHGGDCAACGTSYTMR